MGEMHPEDPEGSRRPNLLVIVADDLGFSDCSSFGSEIRTPHIDQLAQDGLRFTSFHVAAACSPTRAMLMSGTDHHLTGLGQLAEFVRVSPAHQGQPGHEGYMVDSVAALPDLLQDCGYHTIMSGKWHLGLKSEHGPAARGFKRSYALLPGCANHYGYEPQYQDATNEPPPFFETAVTALHAEDGQYVKETPEGFYSSDFYADKMIDYLQEWKKDEDQDKPFFAYLPFSAPHWPLQAPKASVDKYQGFYKDGPSALRLERLQRLLDMGLLPKGVVPHDLVALEGEPKDWDHMLPEEREKSARTMEVFAGMVDRMDECIGRVVDYLKAINEYDNTYIMFMSDNGAEGASYEASPIVGDQVVDHIEKYYDNSLENIGRANSFVWYGSRLPQADGAGAITDSFCTVMDIVPTILELAGTAHPGSEYKGRRVEKLLGKSWVDFLRAAQSPPGDITSVTIHDEDQVTGWEIAGSGALRNKGRHKITFVPLHRGPQQWELFDIIADPGETRDLAAEQPQLLGEMLEAWEKYKSEVGVVGLAGEFPRGGEQLDEFEDYGKCIRFVGKDPSAVPDHLRKLVPS